MNDKLFHNLTIVLILIPIAAGLSGLAVLFGLCGAAYHRVGTVFMTLISALAFLVTLVVWVIEMVLFGIARHRMRDRGIDATWGNANWMVLGALVALFIGFLVIERLNDKLFHNLTIVLILIPIAAGLSGLAVLFGLCGAAYHRVGTVFMTLISALAFLVTLVVWVIEMVLFGIARHRMRDRGIDATWGNANWMVLGALVALFIGFLVMRD